MLGFMDRNQARRWIAEAGIICLGAGALWTGGCAGASRDGLAAGSASVKADARLASKDDVGHASLADSRPKTKKRKPTDRQVAARGRRPRTARTEGDPFLSGPADSPVVAQKQPRDPHPTGTNSVAPFEKKPDTGSTQLASTSRPAPTKRPAQSKSTVAANSRTALAESSAGESTPAATTGPKTVSVSARSTGSAGKNSQRTIAQASASTKAPAETRKPKAPVITPAINEAVGNASTIESPAGYERQRADRLMERAHLMLQHNFREEALRLAAVAEQLEKSKQAVYHPGEERPSELVARLQQPSASADVTDAASIADTLRTESIQKRAYRNRSIPVEPKAGAPRGGRIELTDIHAGWQSAAESNEPDSTAIEPAVAGKAAPLAGENQVAHLETPAGDAGRAISRAATAPAPSDPAVAEAPAPAVLSTDRKGTSETAIAAATAEATDQGPTDSEPIVDTDTAVTPVSRWNATTIGGLIAGLAGLLGLGFWRRQERKHYAAASR